MRGFSGRGLVEVESEVGGCVRVWIDRTDRKQARDYGCEVTRNESRTSEMRMLAMRSILPFDRNILRR